MPIISTNQAIEKLCKKLEKQKFITIDTEFSRDKTYYPKLCLMQIALENEAYIIDTLAKDINLSPIFDIFANKKILKVLHACRQDLEIFYNLTGKLPDPLFDTQVAASVCGFGESVSYEALVNNIAGGKLDKVHRISDWSKRPLTKKQIDYALGDVTHLRPIYEYLVSELKKQGRDNWIIDEMKELKNPNNFRVLPEEAWLKLKAKSNSMTFLATVKSLAAWRERKAQQLNIPRGFVLKDLSLLEIAATKPDTLTKLHEIRNFFSSKAINPIDILKVVKSPIELTSREAEKIKNKKSKSAGVNGSLVMLLKLLLKIKCEENGVAEKNVASAQDLLALCSNSITNSPLMHGWKFDLFGKYAEQLLDGEISISIYQNKITINDLVCATKLPPSDSCQAQNY
jgi:ribonuclease D